MPTPINYQTKPVRGFGCRLIELGPCGEIVPTTKFRYEFTDFIQLTATPNIYNGEELKSYDAAGRPTLIDTPQPFVEYENIVLETDISDPKVQSSLGGGNQILEPVTLNIVGYNNPGASTPPGNPVSIEIWQKPGGTSCGDGTKPYYVHIWPFVKSWVNTQALTIGNSKQPKQWTGKAYESTNWGTAGQGPKLTTPAGTAIYANQVVSGATGTPHSEFRTDVTPPAVTSGVITATAIPVQT
jgi:hypothetical protein